MITRFLGMVVLVGALGCVYFLEGNSTLTGAFRIFHWPAIALTLVGPMALVSVCSDWRPIFLTIKLALGANPRSRQKKHEREAVLLQRLGKDFYKSGSQVFENAETKRMSEFVTKMLDRLANRMPSQDVRDLLETERDRRQVRLTQAQAVLSLGVRLTPSVGMLGTILGMVQLLSSLQDPSKIGSHMSLALLTTFYGLFFSLAVWTPMQQKVEQVLDLELEGYNQSLRWLELLEKRKPSNMFTDSLEHNKLKLVPESKERAEPG